MIIECNTSTLKQKNRIETWRQKIHQAYGSVKVALTDSDESLHGELVSARRGHLRFTTINYRGQTHQRSPADIARLEQEYVTLTRPYVGALTVDSGNSHHVLEPGHIYLFNHAVPYFATPHDRYGTHAIAFPASALRQRGLKLQPSHALSAASHQGRLINALADQLTEHYAAWSDAEFYLLSEQMLDLLAMLFGQPASAGSHVESNIRAAHRLRALAYLRANYGAPDLTPLKIANACGISVSYLHDVFRGADNSVEATVMGERLEQGKKLLIERANARHSIGVIAYMCGFSHPAHFSRAFRNRYHCSPREMRDIATRTYPGIQL